MYKVGIALEVQNFSNNYNFAKVLNEKLLVKSMEHAIKLGILPNIFTDRDTARFGWLNRLRENRWIGQGTLAKMAKIYANKVRVHIFKKDISMDDIVALNEGEVTEAFANIMEKLIAKATLDVKETMANNTSIDAATKVANKTGKIARSIDRGNIIKVAELIN